MPHADPAIRKAKNREWYLRNREHVIAQQKKYWLNRDRSHEKSKRLKYRYGITSEQFAAIVAAQKGKCALCDESLKLGTKSVHVDHCHETGRVRGILCARCNLGIGRFGDTIQGLEKAIAYLKRGLLP